MHTIMGSLEISADYPQHIAFISEFYNQISHYYAFCLQNYEPSTTRPLPSAIPHPVGTLRSTPPPKAELNSNAGTIGISFPRTRRSFTFPIATFACSDDLAFSTVSTFVSGPKCLVQQKRRIAMPARRLTIIADRRLLAAQPTSKTTRPNSQR